MLFEVSETKIADWLMKEHSYIQAYVFIPDACCLYSSTKMNKWRETGQGTMAKTTVQKKCEGEKLCLNCP